MTLYSMTTPFLRMILFALAFVFSTGASAQENAVDNPEGAESFVRTLANDALDVLNNVSLTQEERDQAFRELLRDGFDLNYIGRLVLGRHYRTASAEQQTEFETTFPEYVLKIYAGRLTEFGDEEFVVDGFVPAGKRDVYIRSQVIRPDGPPVAADWRVRLKDGNYKIIDLKVEGISMVLTQREEFAASISQSGLDNLLQQIRRDAGM